MRRLELVGAVFGKLKVVEELPSERNATRFKCVCECGEVRKVRGFDLSSGQVKCCGCSNGDSARRIRYLNPRLYEVWKGMKARCRDPKHASYKNYGGKGVSVCPEWEAAFRPFYEWSIKNGWTEGLQIDKDYIPGILGIPAILYSPEMCCLLTPIENHSKNIKYLNATDKIQA